MKSEMAYYTPEEIYCEGWYDRKTDTYEQRICPTLSGQHAKARWTSSRLVARCIPPRLGETSQYSSEPDLCSVHIVLRSYPISAQWQSRMRVQKVRKWLFKHTGVLLCGREREGNLSSLQAASH